MIDGWGMCRMGKEVRVHNILADRRILRSQGGVSVTRRTAERSVSGIAKNRCAIYGEITRFSGKVTRRKCAGIQKTDQLSVGTGRLAPQMMTRKGGNPRVPQDQRPPLITTL